MTHPLGPDTENLTINVKKEFKRNLRRQAKASGVSMSDYVRGVLMLGLKKKESLRAEIAAEQATTQAASA